MRHLCQRVDSSSWKFIITAGLLVLAAGAGGCSRVSWTMRAGVAYPPKPVPCELTFATQDPMQPWDMSTHQLIGTMVAEHFKGSWDEPLKKAVQEKACPVGADMAAINIITVNPFNGVQSANIMIYRRHHNDSTPQTAAAPIPTKSI